MVVAIDVKKTVNSQEAHLTLETMAIILSLLVSLINRNKEFTDITIKLSIIQLIQDFQPTLPHQS